MGCGERARNDKGGRFLRIPITLPFDSHGAADTLESCEVCCSACILLIIGQMLHWERFREAGRHGKETPVSVSETLYVFLLA